MIATSHPQNTMPTKNNDKNTPKPVTKSSQSTDKMRAVTATDLTPLQQAEAEALAAEVAAQAAKEKIARIRADEEVRQRQIAEAEARAAAAAAATVANDTRVSTPRGEAVVRIADLPAVLAQWGYKPKRKTRANDEETIRLPDGTYEAVSEEVQLGILEMCEKQDIVRVKDIQAALPYPDGRIRSPGAVRAQLKKMAGQGLLVMAYETFRTQVRDIVAKDYATMARGMKALSGRAGKGSGPAKA